jgi:hypothetical protein
MPNDELPMLADAQDVRTAAWELLLQQTLVGYVSKKFPNGDVVVRSEIPFIHPMALKPFTIAYAGVLSVACEVDELISFKVRKISKKNWPVDPRKSPPIIDKNSIRKVDQAEFDEIAGGVLPLIEPFVTAVKQSMGIERFASQLAEIEMSYSQRLSELEVLTADVENAQKVRTQLVTEATEAAEIRRRDALNALQAEVDELRADAELQVQKMIEESTAAAATTLASAQFEFSRMTKLIADEERKIIASRSLLELEREIFRDSGGERFVKALGYNYRGLDRKLEIIERPSDLLAALEQEISRVGVDIDRGTLRRMVTSHALAAMTGQIVLYVGPPGSGKSTSGVLIPTLLGMHSSVIPVRPGWLDATDLLGYFDPRNGRFVSAPFVDLMIDAKADAEVGRLHTVVLDEMNLARIENYGADLISQLEKSHETGRSGVLRLYSPAVQREIDAQKIKSDEKNSNFTEIPAEMVIPANLLISGTINNDDSTEALSQKVIDRCVVVRVPRVVPKPRFDQSISPAPVFTMSLDVVQQAMQISGEDQELIRELWEELMGMFSLQKIPGFTDALSQRFARAIVHAPAVMRLTGIETSLVIDDILSLKTLPWVRYFRSHDRQADDELSALSNRARTQGYVGFATEIESMLTTNDDLVHYLR